MAMPGKLAGRRLLVVEDDFHIAEEMRHAFEAAGAEVIGPAPTVRTALDLLDGTPDLDGAVLDINLRGEMCYAVADALSARGIPFVFATGYDAQHVPARYGQAVCCEKPVEPHSIATSLFG